eukprot:23254_1
MTTKRNLLVNGYVRATQKLPNLLIIPTDINYLILAFYGSKYHVFGIGRNQYGEFALKHHHKITKKWHKLSDFSKRIQSLNDLYCGHARFLIKTEYHQIYCCGKNDRSELGLSINKHRIMKFKQLKQLETSTGPSTYNHQTDYISLISNGKMSKHSFLKTQSGKFYGIGCNHYAQFGNDDKTYEKIMSPLQLCELEDIFNGLNIIQIECGMLHSLFLTSNGTVYACGFNGLGQLGFKKSHKNDFENEYQFTPTKIPFLYDIINICCGNDHNLCVNKNNNLYVFGNNDHSQLGLGHPPIKSKIISDDKNELDIVENEERKFMFEYEKDEFEIEEQPKFVDVPTVHEFFRNKKIKSIFCGGTNAGVILMNGDFYTFGYNFWHQSIGKLLQNKYPQLLQSFDKYCKLKIVDADFGMSHTLILTNENKLYSVGNNNYCQCTNQIKQESIIWPYLISKKEIGVNDNDIIQRVIAGNLSTFVFTSTPLK